MFVKLHHRRRLMGGGLHITQRNVSLGYHADMGFNSREMIGNHFQNASLPLNLTTL